MFLKARNFDSRNVDNNVISIICSYFPAFGSAMFLKFRVGVG